MPFPMIHHNRHHQWLHHRNSGTTVTFACQSPYPISTTATQGVHLTTAIYWTHPVTHSTGYPSLVSSYCPNSIIAYTPLYLTCTTSNATSKGGLISKGGPTSKDGPSCNATVITTSASPMRRSTIPNRK